MIRASDHLSRSVPILLLCLLSLALGGLVEVRLNERAQQSLARGGDYPLVAYLVVRARDCESHLELLRLLQRPAVTRATSNGGALVLDSEAGSRASLELLARELPDVPARRASVLEQRLLRRMGFGGTPTLLILDAETGAVRFSARAPVTVRERVRLLRALAAVTSS